jgi:alpha-tubulin suppressor-like RCC1 family protein
MLGGGNTNNIGDDEVPTAGTYLNFPETPTAIAAGAQFTCTLTVSGRVYCWGTNASGQLGLGHTNNIGDDELATSVSPVDLGNKAVQISADQLHACALLDSGYVKCWGKNDFGQLGYGNLVNVGDGVGPNVSAMGAVSVGAQVASVTASWYATCVILVSGDVKCWGRPTSGQLGYGNLTQIGDDEFPSTIGNVSLGGTVSQICGGTQFFCALLASGAARCWGANSQGQLGLGTTSAVGDDEVPSSVSAINLGGNATHLSCSKNSSPAQGHACAVMATGSVRCWGHGPLYQLGYGNPNNVGDDETPASAGDVPL